MRDLSPKSKGRGLSARRRFTTGEKYWQGLIPFDGVSGATPLIDFSSSAMWQSSDSPIGNSAFAYFPRFLFCVAETRLAKSRPVRMNKDKPAPTTRSFAVLLQCNTSDRLVGCIKQIPFVSNNAASAIDFRECGRTPISSR